MKDYYDSAFMEQYPLSTKKPLKKALRHIIFYVLWILPLFIYLFVIRLFNIFFVSQTVVAIIAGGIVVFSILLFIGLYLYEKWYLRTYFYNLTDDLVIIRKGLISPSEITIPYERIQDIYVDQDILDRWFDLYDVHISSTTAMSGLRAHIDGVEKKTALKLREMLLEKVRTSLAKK